MPEHRDAEKGRSDSFANAVWSSVREGVRGRVLLVMRLMRLVRTVGGRFAKGALALGRDKNRCGEARGLIFDIWSRRSTCVVNWDRWHLTEEGMAGSGSREG